MLQFKETEFSKENPFFYVEGKSTKKRRKRLYRLGVPVKKENWALLPEKISIFLF